MTSVIDAPVGVEAKIDALTEQVAAIAAQMESERRRREAIEDLRDTLVPVAGEAFTVATRELEALRADGSLDELLGLFRRLITSAGSLDKTIAALETTTSLMGAAAPLSGDVVAALTTRLAELDRKGYFEFARHSAGVLERVVTSFDEDDIDQLGDNVVLILQTVKEMTQPEVMHMLRRTATAVQSQQQAIANGTEGTPSLWRLLRQMRDPEVRRGLSRAINMLRIVAADGPQTPDQETKGDG
jgi:uncharacterized protein YjgD (DUF1641 family)